VLNLEFILTVTAFIFIALAANRIGQLGTYLHFPLITGYLLAGAVAGPFILDMISFEAVEQLRFVDELSLAVIAFAAGSELRINELRRRFRSIAWIAAGQLIVTYILGALALFLLADFTPFMQEMDTHTRVAVSLLGGAILVARSPSSAIAIMNELRAKGPFTKTVLSVTVVKDVIVIVVFAITVSVADTILTGLGFNLGTLLLLVAELSLAVVIGVVLGRLLHHVLSFHFDERVKIALMLLLGFMMFFFSETVRELSHDHLPFEVLFEPLLICMVAGFVVVNFSPHQAEFIRMLEEVGPFIFVLFFTLTGASLALDTLLVIWPVTLALFAVRLGAVALGSFGGGVIAGDPMLHNRLSWMAYITQAGVGLGLAKEVADEFPEFGVEFATLMIAVIVINQLVGPPFFKFAVRRVGEARVKATPAPDDIRDVLILGVDHQSMALARQLQAHNWQVIVADTDRSHIERLEAEDVVERHIPEISYATLSELMTNATDAVVAMLGDDDENYKALQLAYEHFGVPRRIVRVNNVANAGRFKALNALVVNPSSAMVHLLDQSVRAPQSVEMLLHRDPEHEIVQITVRDKDIHGLHLREVRLPSDVLVLAITRDGHSIVPHGYTTLHLDDEVTLLGHPKSLDEVTLRLGF